MGIVYKKCILCHQKKPRGCFNKHKSYKDGWNVRCKKCARIKNVKNRYVDVDFARKKVASYGYAKI
jgi:hypothetical protein